MTNYVVEVMHRREVCRAFSNCWHLYGLSVRCENYRRACCFRVTRLHCARRMCTPNNLSIPMGPKPSERMGCLLQLAKCIRTDGGGGRENEIRTDFRAGASFREWVRTPGSSNEGTRLQMALIVVWRWTAFPRTCRFSLRLNGGWVPSSRPVGIRLTNLPLAPILMTFLD